MKILSAAQMGELDARTIEEQHLASAELMERASQAFCEVFKSLFESKSDPVYIFCGSGNNGGDGLAISRLLHADGYHVQVFLCGGSDRRSPDNALNLERLPFPEKLIGGRIVEANDIPTIETPGLIIDALFGTGLNKPIQGFYADLIHAMNRMPGTRVAVDLPSGLYVDRMFEGPVFTADYTISLGGTKRCFYHKEAAANCGKIVQKSIGWSVTAFQSFESQYQVMDRESACHLVRLRIPFSHKGTFGHSLLICGSYGSMGAALLAGRACLRSGTGLLTMHIPRCGYDIAQTALPEAMVSVDPNERCISQIPDIHAYASVGVGCGMGRHDKVASSLNALLDADGPVLILDADALNIIAERQWQDRIPAGSILTPHPKEFSRLFGPSDHSFDRIDLAKERAKSLGIYIVLKGHHSTIHTPDGMTYYNTSGNSGMATGGSGDVLTGIITALVAQGYAQKEAALLGTYIHGLAGDYALLDESEESLIASDIIGHLGAAFSNLKRS